MLYIVGNFDIKNLDYSNKTKVESFMKFMFNKGVLPVINKPTRVTKIVAVALIISFFNQDVLHGVIKQRFI